MDEKQIRLSILTALIEKSVPADFSETNMDKFLAKSERMIQYVVNGQSGQPTSRRRRGKAQE